MINYRVTDQPDDDITALGQRLAAFNTSDVGPSEKHPLAVLVNDDDGTFVGGIYGYTAWGWLFIQWLWVDEAFRGQNIARNMIDQAESEAKSRDCIGAHIDTFNPNALQLYQKSGYETFGTIPDFVSDRDRVFLQKRWR